MDRCTALIGFGEAGIAFARDAGWTGARGYDAKLDLAGFRASKLADFAEAGVIACDDRATALRGAAMVLSLVTADQALIAARDCAALFDSGALWLDMNSVAPDTKRAAADAIGAQARYVDVAVMAPVYPQRRDVPLLVSGPHAAAGADALRSMGFCQVSVVGEQVGDASSIKMIRSVMVKGIEALSAECILAAERGGVRDAVIASLDTSWPPTGWASRFDYNLERMMVHGLRRAAEMEEVVKTLDALGTGSAMSRATMTRQHALGTLDVEPPGGLVAKLRALLPSLTRLEKAA